MPKRFQIVMGDEIVERMDAQCRKLGLTRTAYCCMKLAEAVDADEKKDSILASLPDSLAKALEEVAKNQFGKNE